jgi:hypothetical protein
VPAGSQSGPPVLPPLEAGLCGLNFGITCSATMLPAFLTTSLFPDMTNINNLDFWADEIVPVIASPTSREFDMWSDELGLMLDVEGGITNPDHRRVAMF